MSVNDDFISEQSRAQARALRELNQFVSTVNWNDPLEARDELVSSLPEIVQQWGVMLAEQALAYAETMSTAPAVLADEIPWDKIVASIRWSLAPLFPSDPDSSDEDNPGKPRPSDPGKARKRLKGSMHRHLMQPARNQVFLMESREARWARIPQGTYTCGFCLVMASREGAPPEDGDWRYATSQTAGGLSRNARGELMGDSFHDECDCRVVLIRSPADYPKGYDPDALYAQYKSVHTDGDSLKEVLEKMRKEHPGMH